LLGGFFSPDQLRGVSGSFSSGQDSCPVQAGAAPHTQSLVQGGFLQGGKHRRLALHQWNGLQYPESLSSVGGVGGPSATSWPLVVPQGVRSGKLRRLENLTVGSACGTMASVSEWTEPGLRGKREAES
jgi:hypothetical protein